MDETLQRSNHPRAGVACIGEVAHAPRCGFAPVWASGLELNAQMQRLRRVVRHGKWQQSHAAQGRAIACTHQPGLQVQQRRKRRLVAHAALHGGPSARAGDDAGATCRQQSWQAAHVVVVLVGDEHRVDVSQGNSGLEQTLFQRRDAKAAIDQQMAGLAAAGGLHHRCIAGAATAQHTKPQTVTRKSCLGPCRRKQVRLKVQKRQCSLQIGLQQFHDALSVNSRGSIALTI